MFQLLQTYIAFKCFMFHIYIQRVIGAWPRRWRKGRGKRGGRQMGRTTHLGSCEQGVLALIQAPRSHSHGERRGSGDGVAGIAGVRMWGGARQAGARARQKRDGHARAATIWRSGMHRRVGRDSNMRGTSRRAHVLRTSGR
jgi:hypothetical protein